MRRLTLRAVLLLFVAGALVSVYAAASAFWVPEGSIGLSAGYDRMVRLATPGGPAALAGIVPGDRIDLAATPFEDRRYVAGVGAAVSIGTVVHFALEHHDRGGERDVTLTAVPYEMTTADRFSLLLQCVTSLLFIVVGATLILIRPRLSTWGFGLYCLLELPTAAYPYRLTSASAAFSAIAIYDVVQNIGVVGLVVFALEFPRPRSARWRERIRRGLPALFALLALMTLYPDVANLILGIGAGRENRVLQILFGVVFGLALFVLYDTYRHVALDERERLRWVLIGFGFGLLASYVGTTLIYSSLIPIDPPAWLANALVSLNVLLPLTVAHAVIRHRVLDIDFVIGRALVYATLTTILAGLFALLDWVFGHLLEDFRVSRLLEAAISISIAFAFDSLHKRIETLIETVFFRKRRAAETRLNRLVHELPQARSERVIERALIGEVVDALELTSAALYRQNRGSGFTRTASYGWPDAACTSLDDADLLVLSMRTDKRCVKLAELPWHHSDVPQGGGAPVVAVPMQSRGDLAGIVLYGAHTGGADVDPDELAQLEPLAHAAAIALDELDAERLRGETDRQTSTIRELESRLDELRRLQR